MKIIITCILFFSLMHANAQSTSVKGIWEGKLTAGVSLRIVFHFTVANVGGITATLDSPDQGVTGISSDTAYTAGDSVFVKIFKMHMEFAGKLINDSTIIGVFKQGLSIPLSLQKVNKVTVIHKPQTPLPPFPYNTEDVTYSGPDRSIQFAATITYPAIPPNVNYIKAPTYPVIILISGSGPQNRDSEIFNHKSFAVMADHFTRLGYMVLRYDERGIGSSTGEFANATSEDFTDDVITAFDFIKNHIHADSINISLIGHSEGGLIAPKVANHRKIRSIILLAGPGIPVIDLMTEQNAAILRSSKVNEATVQGYSKLYRDVVKTLSGNKDTAKAIKKAHNIMEKWIRNKDPQMLSDLQLNSETNRKTYISSMAETVTGPWFRYFMNYDPKKELRKLKGVHVFALNGNNDLQVISGSNLAGMRRNLKRSKAASFKVQEINGVNHLFQTCKKCTMFEYGELEETFSPSVLKLMSDWLAEISVEKKSP